MQRRWLGAARSPLLPGSARPASAIVRDADLDDLDAALGELRFLYGWPSPEDPDGRRDDELAGRELIAERLGDEL